MAQQAIAPSRAPHQGSLGAHRALTYGIAVLILFLLGNREIVSYNFTVGYIAAVVTLPLWIRSIVRTRGGPMLILLGAATVVSGIWLTEFGLPLRDSNPAVLLGGISLVVGLLLTAGVVLWAIPIVGRKATALAYGVGMIAGVSPTGLAAENLWKFGFLLPTVICLLGVVQATRVSRRGFQRVLELAVLALLGISAALNDARSFFGMLMLVFVLVLYQCLPRVRNLRASILRTLVTLAGVGVLIYNIGVNLALEGFLGESTQMRSAAQINSAGSLLLGGRPEIAASFALFGAHPLGFGFGAQPNSQDILTAKEGMTRINYDPNNGYVEKYMFGNQFELHSVLGDMWAGAGFVGIALAVFAVAVVLRTAVADVSRRSASALILFFAVYALWNLFFGPLWTGVTTLGLAVGFALDAHRSARRAHSPATPDHQESGSSTKPSVSAATVSRYRAGE